MAGKPDNSSSDSSLGALTDGALASLKKRNLRHAQILEGALPTVQELLSGLPLRHDDLHSDVMGAVAEWKHSRAAKSDEQIASSVLAAADMVLLTADHEALEKLANELNLTRDGNTDDHRLWDRAQVWLAYFADKDAVDRVVALAMNSFFWPRDSVEGVFRIAWATGLRSGSGGEYQSGTADYYVKRGFRQLYHTGDLLVQLATVCMRDGDGGFARLIKAQRDDAGTEDTLYSLDALFNDRKDDDEDDGDDEVQASSGLVVVPAMPAGVGGQKDVRKSWEGLAGKPMPLVSRGDVAGHRCALVAQWPHAAGVIDAVLSDLAVNENVRFRPTLLLGSPGSGKSSLARAICDQVGLPVELVSLAGATDSSAMGTSAQWSTVRESVPLQLVKRSRHASVAMIWDEIEKAGDNRHNGSALDALLPMLEVDQARRHRDLALEVEVDLSMVSHFATANSLEGLPQPVKDRFRVLTMPDPTWKDLGTLTKQIVTRIARERGVDARWFAPLAEDEMDLVRQAWPGGSLRKLTAIVKTIVDGRDRIIGRC